MSKSSRRRLIKINNPHTRIQSVKRAKTLQW